MILLLLLALMALIPLAIGTIVFFTIGKRTAAPPAVSGLLFHSITSRRHAHFSYFSPDKFSRFVELLAQQGISVCTLNEALINDGATEKIVITFDDGFQSFYTGAFPLLEMHAIKVTIFPIAGFIGSSSLWDVLPRQAHLTKEQVKEISKHGHEIGSHTMTHADLTFLDEKELVRELLDSKHFLEDMIGKPVTSLSFPFGSWNRKVWEKAQSLGYTQATCYRCHRRIQKGLIPVHGVYSFDTVEDVFNKLSFDAKRSHAITRCRIIPHFAKGSPLWKFRKKYALV